MFENQTFELSMTLDTEHFKRVLARAGSKGACLKELDDEYLDTSLAAKGVTVIYRDSQYKKKIRLLVNVSLVMDDPSDTSKLLRKLDKRITGYFNHKFRLDDFVLCGVNFIVDMNVGSRTNVSDYLKVIQRVGKVKGFSPTSYNNIDEKCSFCLSGNSNDIDFLLYDLERTVMGQLRSANASRKKLESASIQTKRILRAEVRLTKPKAIRGYTDLDTVSGQIIELSEHKDKIFMETFGRAIPYGDFHKKGNALDIIRHEVKDSAMRHKMIRLVTLIPEKKSLHLAQKAMNCRDVDKVMGAFAKINLSPVTISKRHDVKKLENLYSFL